MPSANGFIPGKGFSQEDWDEVSDNPEWTEDDFARAKPMKDADPEFHARIMAAIAAEKAARTPVSIRLDPDLAQRLQAIGPGWESRVNDFLRRWLDEAA
jgi:uncharacterized protein (DUF4415 family)